ncbi:MAG: hypothetical protein OIF32_02370 [Campylobacterales bacterium]|nr:hypothetical protein [Campylobacterales bacterium]
MKKLTNLVMALFFSLAVATTGCSSTPEFANEREKEIYTENRQAIEVLENAIEQKNFSIYGSGKMTLKMMIADYKVEMKEESSLAPFLKKEVEFLESKMTELDNKKSEQ